MIKQAIIPLAGQGTRLLPLTSVFAKELLPINGKPGIEYILDECIEAGIKEIIFIISNKKKMIKNYFYSDVFYKKIIKKKKDPRIISEYKKILKYKKLIKSNIEYIHSNDLVWNMIFHDWSIVKAQERTSKVIEDLIIFGKSINENFYSNYDYSKIVLKKA